MRDFTWEVESDSSEKISFATTSTKFGDGYEQNTSVGINPTRVQWQCSKRGAKTEIDAIRTFLLSTRGVEIFGFTPVAGEPELKVRLDGEPTRKQVGGNIWSISFNLIQMY